MLAELSDPGRGSPTDEGYRGRCSGGAAVVVAQESTETLPASKPAFPTSHFLPRFQDLVLQPLMIPFLVIMGKEFTHGPTKGFLAEKDEAI